MWEREDLSVSNARQADYVGFLHRHPFATEAYELGFAPGVREDYSYRVEDYPNVDLPVVILDNDFRNPDTARYLDRFEQYDPSVAVLGDAYTRWDAEQYQKVINELREEYPYKEYIVVPKCRAAFDELDEEVTLGMPLGYSEESWKDFSDLTDWRSRDIHLLGGNPHKQYDAIQELTQPTVTGHQPADIVGMDWNGPHKGALVGEYWTPDGWEQADQLTVRETVRKSLEEIKRYWQDQGVWPETEPINLYGPAVEEPDELLYMDQGGDPIPSREALESAYVDEYEDKGVLAFASETQKDFIEYRENLTQT